MVMNQASPVLPRRKLVHNQQELLETRIVNSRPLEGSETGIDCDNHPSSAFLLSFLFTFLADVLRTEKPCPDHP
jgi:hypothetical protein